MMTDPIADMLTRIRNAQAVKKHEVVLPYSKLKFNILNLLQQEGWIAGVEVIKGVAIPQGKKVLQEDISAQFDRLKVSIIYNQENQPKIKSLKKISKPGRRIYVTKESLPKVLNGWGIAIISTSKGLMTDKQARKSSLGGEVLFEIY